MNRVQFIIVTTLAGILALCIFLQLFLSWSLASRGSELRRVNADVQVAQADYEHLQQIANAIHAVAEKQNDQQLRDLLARQNIKISDTATNAPAPAPAPAQNPAPASSTH
jgi:cell division protein FtsB